jgi:hypothetical protein
VRRLSRPLLLRGTLDGAKYFFVSRGRFHIGRRELAPQKLQLLLKLSYSICKRLEPADATDEFTKELFDDVGLRRV